KAARARADDADGFHTLDMRDDGLHPAFFPGGVGDVFLDRADGDGAMAGLFDDAIAFAKPVLRADAAADLGEGIGGLADLPGLFQPALSGEAQPVGNIVVERAMRLAIGHATLRAAAGLFRRLFRSEFAINFAEILIAVRGFA